MALERETILRDHAFVRGLSAKQLSSLAAIATDVSFEENQIILADREHSSAFYFVVSGSVAIELRAARYAVCVQALGPGKVFGWSALLDQQDTLFQVRAREQTKAVRIAGDALKTLCREDPVLGAEFCTHAPSSRVARAGHRRAICGDVRHPGLVSCNRGRLRVP